MANAVYRNGLVNFADGDINWTSHDIRVDARQTTAFTATHEFRSQLAATLRGTATLTGKSAAGGALFAADTVITPSAAGTVNRLVLYRWTGSDATSPLIAWYDTWFDGSPINFSLTAAGVTIHWPRWKNGIFKL